MCYSKTILKEQILASDVPEESYMNQILINSFPKPLQERFSKQMQDHPLRREIIATRLSNIIVNEMGFTYVYRLQDETGAPVSAIVRAYMITRIVLDLESIWKQIEELGTKISAQQQVDMMMLLCKAFKTCDTLVFTNSKKNFRYYSSSKVYSQGVIELKKCLPAVFSEHISCSIMKNIIRKKLMRVFLLIWHMN